MAKIKLSELTETTEVADSTYLITDTGSNTNKVTKANLLKNINAAQVNGIKFITLTQAEYDALTSRESNVLYIITD